MTPIVSDEQDLIDAARTGSVIAFTELVHQYRDRLLRFLVTRCQSYADAEDALQDTFLSAFRYLHTYDARWRFSTWLYRIALRNAAGPRGPEGSDPDTLPAAGSDPLEQCIAASERQNLWLVARRVLSDDVYAALWLRTVEDMSVRDVATVVNRSESWTKVNLMRARQSLDAALNDDAAPGRSEVYGRA